MKPQKRERYSKIVFGLEGKKRRMVDVKSPRKFEKRVIQLTSRGYGIPKIFGKNPPLKTANARECDEKGCHKGKSQWRRTSYLFAGTANSRRWN